MKISLPWYYFFPLKAKYFRQHPYKTTVKFMVSYVLIFKFLGIRMEDMRFWIEW